MQKYTDLVLGQNGQTLLPQANALVTVLTFPGGAVASIFSDNGITPAANPVSTDINGRFFFYAANGRYSLQVNYLGVTYSIPDFPLEDDPLNGQSQVITGGSIDNTPIGATTPSTGTFTVLDVVPSATPPAANGQIASSSTQNTLVTQQAGLNLYLSSVIYSQTSNVVTSGTTASSWVSSGIGTVTVPANYLVAGSNIRIRAVGQFATSATPGTVILAISLGASSVIATGAVTPVASIVTSGFEFECDVNIRGTGATAASVSWAKLQYVNSLVTPNVITSMYAGPNGSATVNTTTSNAINVTTTNSVSGGAVFTVLSLTVEILA